MKFKKGTALNRIQGFFFKLPHFCRFLALRLRSVTDDLGTMRCLAALTLIEIRISTASYKDSSVQLKIYTAVRLLK